MSASANQAPVLVVGGGIGGLVDGAGAVAQGHPGAGAGTGAGVQGDRRRHPARPQRVPHVRGARPDRADVPLVRVSGRPGVPRFDHRRDHRRHEDRQAVPRQIPRALRRHSPRRHAQRHPRRLQEIEPDQARHLAEGGRDRRHRLGRHREDRDRRDLQGRGADRLRRAVVHGAREDRRRRQAGGVRPHRLSRRAADLRMAEGIPPAQDDRLVRREDPSGALSAAPRRAVQPRRGVPLRPLRGRLGHLRRSGRAARALRGQVRAGAHAAAKGQRLEDVGAVRPPGDQELDQGPHHAAGRRRASDASVSRAGRQHRDGGCRLPRQPGRGERPATTRRRSRNTRSCVICAPRGCSSWRACSARSITPAASIASCATSCCANGAEEGSVDMSWLYGHQPELPHVENVPMPPPTRLAS